MRFLLRFFWGKDSLRGRIKNGLSSPGIKESKLWALHMLESSGQLPFLQAIIVPENNQESPIPIPQSLFFNRKGCSPPPSLCRSTFAFSSQNICHRGLNVLRWGLKTCLWMIHFIINAKVRDSQIASFSNLTSKRCLWVICYCWGNLSVVEGRFSKWF